VKFDTNWFCKDHTHWDPDNGGALEEAYKAMELPQYFFSGKMLTARLYQIQKTFHVVNFIVLIILYLHKWL
jgi:hypothetical protein